MRWLITECVDMLRQGHLTGLTIVFLRFFIGGVAPQRRHGDRKLHSATPVVKSAIALYLLFGLE